MNLLPPAVTNGQRIVKFQTEEVDTQSEKWKSAL